MDHRFRYWMLTALAGVSLVLVLVNILLYDRNRNLQADIANRNLYIQQSLQFENIYQPLLRTLADLSVRHNDVQLRALLAAQGITVNVASPAPAPDKPVESTESTQSTESTEAANKKDKS
ncbi:MAG: hypothetical protein H6973_12975 [Gammaproteobacteria bacterium]|nr:hypothetical protein [Gammaproteobacteria bacterium]HRX72205.1 hypothetical protein [Candidatus Competibacteraceae bacterium]